MAECCLVTACEALRWCLWACCSVRPLSLRAKRKPPTHWLVNSPHQPGYHPIRMNPYEKRPDLLQSAMKRLATCFGGSSPVSSSQNLKSLKRLIVLWKRTVQTQSGRVSTPLSQAVQMEQFLTAILTTMVQAPPSYNPVTLSWWILVRG